MAHFLSLFSLLIAVAFFTLLERKVLSYIILRKGPNKPRYSGFMTPFADALKLLSKPFIFITNSSSLCIYISTYISFIIPCLLFGYANVSSPCLDTSLVVLILLIWISLSVYALLGAGLGSNSKYSTLGGLRALAQAISYEVCLTTLLLSCCLLSGFAILSSRVH